MQRRIHVVFVALAFGSAGLVASSPPVSAVGSPSSIVVVPSTWTDPVTAHVFDLDATGGADVSDGLNIWLGRGVTTGAIPQGSAAAPTIIQFPPNAQYRVEYGLETSSTGADRVHPGVPQYRLAHAVIDFNGGRIFQTDDTAYKGGKPVVQSRRRWGVQLLTLRLVDDVTIENGTIQGHHPAASDTTYGPHASWHGVQISGSSNVVLRDMTIDNVWGDFIYLGGTIDRSTRPAVHYHDMNIVVDDVAMNVNGRQGITISDADGLVVQNSSIASATRFVIDSEVLPTAVVRDISFVHNEWNDGGLGFFNMSASPKADVGNLVFSGNVWMHGHMHLNIAATKGVTRHDLTIVDNTVGVVTGPSRSALVHALGWTGVVITGNADPVVQGVKPLQLTPGSDAVTTPNNFS